MRACTWIGLVVVSGAVGACGRIGFGIVAPAVGDAGPSDCAAPSGSGGGSLTVDYGCCGFVPE